MNLDEILEKLEGNKSSAENILEKSAETIDSNEEISYNTNIKNEEKEISNTPNDEMLEKMAQAKDKGIIMAREMFKELTKLMNQ